MKTSIIRTGLASAMLISSVSHAALSWAQDRDDDEVVVTAQFREQNLQDTPLAITAVDAGTLESRGQFTIDQVALQAPSVQLAPLGGAYGVSIGTQIRGVGQFDFNPAYEPGVGMYIDDVYLATLVGANLELLDLERVEILRGPQGTLTGRNSIGGAIRLISKKPTGDGSGYVYAGYGTSNRIGLRGAMDLGLSENLAMRVSGTYRSIDGYIDRVDYGCANPNNTDGVGGAPIPIRTNLNDCVVQELGAESYGGVRAQALWSPSENLEITFTGDYVKQDNSQAPDVTVESTINPNFICGDDCIYSDYGQFTDPSFTDFGGNPLGSTTLQDPNQHFEGYGLSADIDWNLSENVNLRSITAYRDYQTDFGTDDDAGPSILAGAGGSSGGSNFITHNFFSQELRLSAQMAENIEFTVGGFYSDQETVYETFQDIRYILPFAALAFYGNDPVNADSFAVFGTGIWSVTDNLTLTGGLRYTEESKDYTFVRRDPTNRNIPSTDIFGVGALDGVKAEASGDQVDYRITADYRLNEQAMVYGTISTGFKGGGVTARPFFPDHALFGSFDPETATNYEIGTKLDLIDDTLRLNLAAYQIDYADIQLPLSDCSNIGSLPAGQNPVGPCAVVANAGDATYKGFEAEMQFTPGNGFMIDGSLSYLDAKYDSVTAAAGGGSLNLDDPAAFAPDWKYSLGIQKEFDVSSGTVTPRVDISYVGDRFTGRDAITTQQTFLDGYTLVNARLAWKNEEGDFTLAIEASNLFDEQYDTFFFDAVQGFAGTAYNTRGRGQEFFASVRKNF